MKTKIISLLVLISTFSACQQKDLDTTSKTADEHTFEMIQSIPSSEAQLKFAKILSKAVYDDEDIRSFIQKEALKQFDCDYDILYGKVKNKEVKAGLTFKQALDAYAENENTLDQIEKSAPLINILLPDLEFVGGLSAKKWDISNNRIGVVPDLGNSNNTVYGNGDSIYAIGKSEIPKFPMLVVKTNERVIVKLPATKSSEAEYEFSDEVFNPNNKPKSKNYWRTEELLVKDDCSIYLHSSKIYPPILKSLDDKYGICQRDYAYFDVNGKSITSNRKNIKERLIRMRFNNHSCHDLIYDPDATDPQGKKIIIDNGDPRFTKFKQSKRFATAEEINRKIWAEGSWEFQLRIIRRLKDGSIDNSERHTIIATGRDLFSISRVSNYRVTPGWFSHSSNEYEMSSEDINAIKAKWFYPGKKGEEIWFSSWDITNESTTRSWILIELDPGNKKITKKITETYTDQDVWNFTANSKFAVKKVNFDITGSYKNTNTQSTNVVTNYTLEDKDDVIGEGTICYSDPLIIKKLPVKSGGYYPSRAAVDGNSVVLTIQPDIDE